MNLGGIPTRAQPAWRALANALTDHPGVPCDGRPEWTSECAEDREAAAYRCEPCPVLDICAAYAAVAKERHGTWAGADRTRPTSRKDIST